MRDFGVIAEDAAAVLPEVVNMRKARSPEKTPQGAIEMVESGTPKPYSIRNAALTMLILDQLQKLDQRIAALEPA